MGKRSQKSRSEFDESYGRIFGTGPKKKLGSGTWIHRNGKWTRARGALDGVRVHDSKNIVSTAVAVQPEQVAQSTREIHEAGLGSDMKYRKDGKVVFKNRNAKFRCMKVMGVVDFDEVRG